MSDPEYGLGDDGELHEIKRKPKEDWDAPPPQRRIVSIVGLIGLILVSGVIGGLIARFAFPWATPTAATLPGPIVAVTATAAAPSAPLVMVVTATPGLTPEMRATPAPAFSDAQTGTGRLIVSLGDKGDLYQYAAAQGLTPLNLQGHDIAAAPDGKLAYWRFQQVYLYQDGKEINISSFGDTRKPALSSDGKTIVYVSEGANGQGKEGTWLVSMRITTTIAGDNANAVDFDPTKAATPLFDPITRDLLFITPESEQLSNIYQPDVLCACNKHTQFATVPYYVTWASYAPDGSRIIFSDQNGNFYQLDTKTKATSNLLVDNVEKYRPTFSPDGKQIAYFDDTNQIYIWTLATNDIQSIPMNQAIDSFAWFGA